MAEKIKLLNVVNFLIPRLGLDFWGTTNSDPVDMVVSPYKLLNFYGKLEYTTPVAWGILLKSKSMWYLKRRWLAEEEDEFIMIG